MERINIKPISLNEAYSGRRFSTPKLTAFKKLVLLYLRPKKIPDGELELTIHFGFSSKGSDLDNHVKCFLDCLQVKYGFNDNRVYKMNLTKSIVSKENEFIEYEIKELI